MTPPPVVVPIPVEEPRDDARRFATFVLTGGCAAAVNVGTRALLSVLRVPFEAAVALAYLVGMTTAFLLARRFVFAAQGPWWREYAKFAAVNAVSFVQVLGVSELFDRVLMPLVGWTWKRELLAHAIGVASPIITSFYAHKHFSFRRASPSEAAGRATEGRSRSGAAAGRRR